MRRTHKRLAAGAALMAALALGACGSSSTTVGAGGSTTSSTGSGASSSTASIPSGTQTTVATTAPTSSTTAGGLATEVVSDCATGAYKPARIVATCPTTKVVVTDISWTTWTASAASGTASAQVDGCQPTCAAQSAVPYPATVALSDPVSSARGPRFSRLTLTWSGKGPFGHPSDAYALVTSA